MLFLRECRKALYRVYKQYNYKALEKMIAFLQWGLSFVSRKKLLNFQ